MKIIFLTSSAEFAVESYTVGAYFYQLKPIWEESFFRLMDSVIAECEKSSGMSLILRCKSGITRVELDKLEYCEVLGHSLWLHLVGGTVLESVGRMDHLCEQLADHPNFLRVHRSFLYQYGPCEGHRPQGHHHGQPGRAARAPGEYAELKDRVSGVCLPPKAGVPVILYICNTVAVGLFGIILSAASATSGGTGKTFCGWPPPPSPSISFRRWFILASTPPRGSISIPSTPT